MASSRRILHLFVGSLIFWLVVMGSLYYLHYIRNVDEELGYFSADVKFDASRRQYYGIFLGDQKIGYKSETQYIRKNMKIFREDVTLKLNLAGMSREVFLQSVTGIDSTTLVTRYMDFTLDSGNHTYNFSAQVREDSLIIGVKKDVLSAMRKGFFPVNEHITMPVSLPYFLHNADTEALTMQIFDPVDFSRYLVHSVRKGPEIVTISGRTFRTVRYDLLYKDIESSLWLDSNGAVVKSTGIPIFGDILGSLTIEKAMDKNVFLLPLEVSYGNDRLKRLAVIPRQQISSPRDVTFLEVEFVGMRAANIDITTSNKKIISVNPLIMDIFNKPLTSGEYLMDEIKLASADTSLLGMSDYIQPYDARIRRTARTITTAVSDTLDMAHALNQWVFSGVRQEEGLDIVRSVDILRDMRGDCDERTKLFTALARSVGIPTQINTGLVYKDSAFRYHSWPSVFVGGVWHDLDPTFGQDNADATHISLVRGDFDKLIELLRIINSISLIIHSCR
ncbi:transglutaminase-like domain-containing protein [bacterium]|nr:transglutaminase-like domain-containing protein [bacterium]